MTPRLSLGEILVAVALTALLCSLGGCDVAEADATAPVDVTGEWRGTLTMQAGPMPIDVTLEQAGEAVTGTALLHYVWSASSSPFYPRAVISGDVTDGRVSLLFEWPDVGALWAVEGAATSDQIAAHLENVAEYTLSLTRRGP